MKKQSELINEYLYYGRKQRKLDEKTIRAYRIDLEQFSDFSEQEEIVMSREVIRQYILRLHDIYKQKTVKRKIASLKAFYSYLEEEEIIEDSPMRKVRTEFREEKVLPRTIPYSTLEMLLSYMYSLKLQENNTECRTKLLNRDIAVVETLFATGIRISELCNLPQKNIDLEQGIFCIKGKGNKERSKRVSNALLRHGEGLLICADIKANIIIPPTSRCRSKPPPLHSKGGFKEAESAFNKLPLTQKFFAYFFSKK